MSSVEGPLDPENLRKVGSEFDFPVSDYLDGQIRKARTLSRTGRWWSAILLMEEKKGDGNYIAMYRWKREDDRWKRSKKFTCRSREDADVICEFLENTKELL